MAVRYEWDIEEVDDLGEIVDHNFRSKLTDFGDDLRAVDGARFRLVLVRDSINQFGDLKSRAWAYASGYFGSFNFTPEFFVDSTGSGINKVPRRFLDELAKANGNNKPLTKEKRQEMTPKEPEAVRKQTKADF